MKANTTHTFSHNGSEVTFTERHGVVMVTAKKCGMSFDVAEIVDVGNENPLIYFHNFTGINLVVAVMREWDKIQNPLSADWEKNGGRKRREVTPNKNMKYNRL